MEASLFCVKQASIRTMVDNRPELWNEVKLFDNARERERFDNNSEVYSIVKTIQTLEKAYSKDFIKPEQ